MWEMIPSKEVELRRLKYYSTLQHVLQIVLLTVWMHQEEEHSNLTWCRDPNFSLIEKHDGK